MKETPLFVESLEMHQKLVDILVEARDEKGISLISQPEMAKKINRSQTWVASAIKRLNTEDVCVEMIASGKYKLHYDRLIACGVFSKILALILITYGDSTLLMKKDREIAEEYELNIKTVQMYKAYMKTR